MTLNDELTVIDEALAELEGRRTAIINRMDASSRPQVGKNVIVFPNRPSVIETSYKGARYVW